MIIRPRRPARAAQSGMTLIEMLVVCVILTIVTAVTIPIFGEIGAMSDAHGQPIRMQSLLLHCRELAIHRGARVRLDVDSSSSSAWVRIPVADSVERQGPIAIDTTTEFMAARPTFFCYPSGVVQGPSIAVREGRTIRRATIEPITGRVSEHR